MQLKILSENKMKKNDQMEAIRVILLYYWDPLNIGENNNIRDEYDAYIPHIIKILKSDRSSERLYHYLLDVEIKLDCLGSFSRRAQTVNALLDKKHCD